MKIQDLDFSKMEQHELEYWKGLFEHEKGKLRFARELLDREMQDRGDAILSINARLIELEKRK